MLLMCVLWLSGSFQDTYLGNYKIPKGAMVMPLQWALHMDSDVWENPEEFSPSRFLAEDGSLLKPQEFIPFQTGKHKKYSELVVILKKRVRCPAYKKNKKHVPIGRQFKIFISVSIVKWHLFTIETVFATDNKNFPWAGTFSKTF
jgi:hypothetical protein